jgi:hypothetical protein
LDIEPEIEHCRVDLRVDLGLAIGAHAAEHTPELAFALADRGDERVEGDLAGSQAVGVIGVERKIGASVLQHHTAATRDDGRAE